MITYEFTAPKTYGEVVKVAADDIGEWTDTFLVPLEIHVPRELIRGDLDELQGKIAAGLDKLMVELNDNVR